MVHGGRFIDRIDGELADAPVTSGGSTTDSYGLEGGGLDG